MFNFYDYKKNRERLKRMPNITSTKTDFEDMVNDEKEKTWDKYFFDIACLVAKNSKCLSRKAGAVLTKERRIIATGYNSPPSGIENCSDRMIHDKKLDLTNIIENIDLNICPRRHLGFKSGEGLEYCPAIHAEMNCLLTAAYSGASTKDSVLYFSDEITPCSQCFGAMINAGVKEVVVKKINIYDATVEWLLSHNKLTLREYNF